MRVSSLDQVKVELERIIAGAALKQDPIGLFPSLYRQMTGRVGEAITAGRFDDGPRMGRFVVSFANRYLDAEAAWSAGCDMLLVCNAPDQVANVLQNWHPQPDPVRAARLERLRPSLTAPNNMAMLVEDPRWGRGAAECRQLLA